MYTHPDIARQPARERHRDMRVHAASTAWPASSATWPGRPGAPRESSTGSAAPGARHCGCAPAPTPHRSRPCPRPPGLRRQRGRLRPTPTPPAPVSVASGREDYITGPRQPLPAAAQSAHHGNGHKPQRWQEKSDGSNCDRVDLPCTAASGQV